MSKYFHSLKRRLVMYTVSLGLLTGGALQSATAGELVKVPSRVEVKTTVFWQATPDATATLFIFPGGGGGFGKVEEGWPTSNNFLVRTSKLWAKEKFNLAIFGRPNDSDDLGYDDRISETHMQDVKAVLAWVKTQSAAPIWVVGTSRGTVSAAATLIRVADPQIAGGVVTSSVVEYKYAGALPRQDLGQIKVPVLVYHHAKDACHVCLPHEVPSILKGLKNSPHSKLMMVSGGANPTGSPCAGQHWHGFIGMEQEAVSSISAWIRDPKM